MKNELHRHARRILSFITWRYEDISRIFFVKYLILIIRWRWRWRWRWWRRHEQHPTPARRIQKWHLLISSSYRNFNAANKTKQDTIRVILYYYWFASAQQSIYLLKNYNKNGWWHSHRIAFCLFRPECCAIVLAFALYNVLEFALIYIKRCRDEHWFRSNCLSFDERWRWQWR